MQDKEKPIVVNMAEKQDSLTILQGQAPKQLDELAPVKIEISGTIDAPLRWLEKRVGDIDQHKAYLHVNRDKLHMVLIIAEDDPYKRGTVSGKLQLSEIFRNIPPSFKLRLPIFSGGDPVEIDVETYASIDGSDVTVSLQSAGAYDAVEDVKLNEIGRVIEQICEIAPELVIIEQ